MERELQKLEGTVDRLIFENRDTGYTVVEVCSGDEYMVAAGNMGEVYVGESIVAYGWVENHPTHGEQFKVQSCQASMPQDEQATLAYLSSGALPYVGPAMAKKLMKHFGGEVLQIIAEQPDRLTEIKGITPNKADAISKEFRRMFGVREVVAWLAQFGVSAQQAVNVFRAFGPKTIEALSQNPYLLCGEPLFMKFAQADLIAAELQLAQEGSMRVWAALLYVLRRNAGNGHTCLPRRQLVTTTAEFIKVAPEKVDEHLTAAVEQNEIGAYVREDQVYLYLPDLFLAEREIAFRLAMLAENHPKPPKNLEENIRALEFAQGFSYAPLQRKAMETALSSNIMVLTGGPGTGKTTAINAILALFENEYDRVALCAPTGRAAKRLSEVTGHKASTIHRLLEVDYSSGEVRFVHNEKNRLKVDVVILDEMSMVDSKLFQALLNALKYSCRLILVGDTDQLPSVGPGNVLGEAIRSGILPTVRLTEIFRQAEKSLIITNAHRIVEGEMPIKGKKEDDFFFLEAGGLACQQLVCDLVSTRLPRSYQLDPVRDIQVLCPTKVGPAGATALNRCLQQILNPPMPGKAELQLPGERIFRKGDKVMQIRNNYDIPFERDGGEAGVGAYNGDMGIITEVDLSTRSITVQMDDKRYTYPAEHLLELEPAYAVTIHKSQGSEFPVVVLPAAEVPAKLCYRNLLYTGVTRARKLCIVAGQRATLQTMVANRQQNLRYSCLADMIREEQQKGSTV